MGYSSKIVTTKAISAKISNTYILPTTQVTLKLCARVLKGCYFPETDFLSVPGDQFCLVETYSYKGSDGLLVMGKGSVFGIIAGSQDTILVHLPLYRICTRVSTK
jgi:hypothetical protein